MATATTENRGRTMRVFMGISGYISSGEPQ
jgi:hypothetical protein